MKTRSARRTSRWWWDALVVALLVQVTGLISRGARLLTRFGKLQALAATDNLDWTLRSFYRREWRRCALSVGLSPARLADAWGLRGARVRGADRSGFQLPPVAATAGVDRVRSA